MQTKIRSTIVALAFMAALVPLVGNAQTATVEEMQKLLKQVAELQAKLKAIEQNAQDVRGELKDALTLVRDLREGMTSDDVTALQEILAADPDVYPEGMITGYYGPLTAKAVRKFQEKHGIDAAGVVGPKTRAKINELLKNGEFRCKAWGKLIAPGQRKKVGNVEVDLSHCSKVPAGIKNLLDRMGTTTATSTATSTDTKAPVIKNLRVPSDEIEEEEAKVLWNTNEKTTSVLWYNTDDDVLDGSPEKVTDDSLRTSHEIELDDLNDKTKYYLLVVATDKAGNTATSSVMSFVTDEEDESNDDEDEEEDD